MRKSSYAKFILLLWGMLVFSIFVLVGCEQREFYGAGLGSRAYIYIRERLPHAEPKILELPEGLLEIKAGRLRGYVYDNIGLEYNIAVSGMEDVEIIIPPDADTINICVGISRSTKIAGLRDSIESFLQSLRLNGELQRIEDYWIRNPTASMPDIPRAENPVGKIVVGTSAMVPPFTFYKDGELAGVDIELSRLLALRLNYEIEFRVLDYNSIVVAAATGSIDCIFANLNWTPERAESIDLSTPYGVTMTAILVRRSQDTNASDAISGDSLHVRGEKGLVASICDGVVHGVERNFIREGRWKFVLNGLGITALITFSSGIAGFILGLLVCMLRMGGNSFCRRTAAAFVKFVLGLPVVVLLMFVYYVVFGSIDIPGVAAAIVAFTISFAASSSEIIRNAIEAVDRGQTEAAYALGYGKVSTFVKIVLPQASRIFLPIVRGELIALLKNTSVVGYVAVVDLTRAADIIRSRTLDALFPLVAASLVYFAVAWIIAYAFSRMEMRIRSRKRNLP